MENAELEEYLDKRVQNYTLDKIEDRKLFISVIFKDTTAISSDLLDADRLVVEITLPEVFIDAKTK